MTLRQHEIAEAGVRILDPFSEAKLRLLGEIARVGPATQVLDLCCGKGELLCRWAEWFGATGTGVDISGVFLPAAVARAEELGVADRVRFERADASTWPIEPGSVDIASCIGATWIGDGLVGTGLMLRPAVRPGGFVLLGEPFWLEPAPPEAQAALDLEGDACVSLVDTADRIAEAGLELVEMVLASPDDWDRYEAAQWLAVSDWLAGNPDHELRDEMTEVRTRWRETYLRWGRSYLGWGVFVTRPR